MIVVKRKIVKVLKRIDMEQEELYSLRCIRRMIKKIDVRGVLWVIYFFVVITCIYRVRAHVRTIITIERGLLYIKDSTNKLDYTCGGFI